MKFFLLLFYFFRSVSMRGLWGTIQLLYGEMVFEKKLGLKTSAIKKSNSSRFFHYQGAPYTVLFRLFNELSDRTKHLEFIDIGCGKGRAVFAAEYCGYTQLKGIELDGQLLEDAKRNEKTYVFKRKNSVINFFKANALEFEYKDSPALYFLFNPFNEEVLEQVLEKILASTRSETWFIYMNPQFTKPFRDKQAKVVAEFKTGRYLEALVFRFNLASAPS